MPRDKKKSEEDKAVKGFVAWLRREIRERNESLCPLCEKKRHQCKCHREEDHDDYLGS
jgi:hypothetical protein